jgi:hypothetical protein
VSKLLISKKLALILLFATAHGSAALDGWTTRRAMRVPGAREDNPFMRPFARSGAVYAATQVDIIAAELLMGKLPKKWRWTGYAWVAGAAGIHLAFGAQNLRSLHDPQFSQSGSVPGWGPNGLVKANSFAPGIPAHR